MADSSRSKRGRALKVYLTPVEAGRATELAARRGLSASAWARSLVLEHLQEAGNALARKDETSTKNTDS